MKRNEKIEKEHPHLIDVWLGPRRRGHNRLDKARYLGHDVHAVRPFSERPFQDSADGLGVRLVACPFKLDRTGLGPLILRIVLDVGMDGLVAGARGDDLTILDNTSHIDQC